MVSESRSIDDVLADVYQGLRRPIGRVLQKYRIPVEDAEDLIQTVLLLAVSKWSAIRDPEAWLIGTLQNRCILYWRGRLQFKRRFVQLDATAEPAAAPAQARWELLADLGAASRRLPATQRRLVVLRFQLGLTSSEAATATGLADSSVRKILNRGLASLREQLGEHPRRPAPARPRRRPPAVWKAAVESWLGASSLRSHTRGVYRSHVAAAEVTMGNPPLAELALADLATYRAALLEDGRAPGTHVCEMQALRSFLLWALGRGLHGVDAESIRMALRGWHLGGRRRRTGFQAAGTQGRLVAAAGRRDHGGDV